MATNPVIITFCQLEDLFLSLKCDRFTVLTRQNIIDKLMQDFSISQERQQKRVKNGVQAFLNYRSKLRQKKVDLVYHHKYLLIYLLRLLMTLYLLMVMQEVTKIVTIIYVNTGSLCWKFVQNNSTDEQSTSSHF